jgi:hypothetical protein
MGPENEANEPRDVAGTCLVYVSPRQASRTPIEWCVHRVDRGPWTIHARRQAAPHPSGVGPAVLLPSHCLPAIGNCPGRVHRWTFAEISSKNCNFPQLFGTPGEACRWHGSIRKSRHAKQIWPDTRFPGRSRSLVAGPPPKLQYQIPLIVHYLRRLSVDLRKRRARESRNQNPALSCDRAE